MEQVPGFGKWLQLRRKALDLTQDALAKRMGCSTATVRKLEAELRRPSRRIASRLAEFLEIKDDERADFLLFARRGWSDRDPAPQCQQRPPWRTPANPGNLPVQLTDLIGREDELAHAQAVLAQQDTRLLTLTGPGGTGKTRLALELAAQLRGTFADGVFFVSLAPIREPALIAATIAGTLGVRESGDQSLVDDLKDHLQGQHLLLVLDNFEHVMKTAWVVADLLAACPVLHVLVTSRERLRLRGERELPVPPLKLPEQHTPLQDFARYPAVEVFARRALDVKPGFAVNDENAQAIAQICARLDGLPLAIELAAARIKMFSPQVILGRLENRFALLTDGARDSAPRQQTLHAAITWSYELLGQDEKKLFQRLAVFAGGFTPETIEAICTPDGSTAAFRDLASLIDKNLLLRQPVPGNEPRFAMLESIHEYAKERLEESEDALEMHRRHAAYFVALAVDAEPGLRTKHQASSIRRLNDEHDNLRAALRWLLDHEDVENASRLAVALGGYWYLQGHLKEGQQWLTAVLPIAKKAMGPVKARIFLQACNLAWKRRELDAAAALGQQCLVVCRFLDDEQVTADALHSLGNVALERGEPDEARAYYLESLTLRRAQGDSYGMSVSLNGLGESARLEHEPEQARPFYEESLALARQIGDFHRSGIALHNLGQVAFALGHYESAASHYAESLVEHREIGDLYGVATLLAALAEVAAMRGLAERAARLFGAAEALFDDLGTHLDIADRQNYDRSLTAARNQIDGAVWQRKWQEGSIAPLEESVAYALDKINTAG